MKKALRLAVVLLIFSLLLSMPAFATGKEEPVLLTGQGDKFDTNPVYTPKNIGFPDVSVTDWFYDAVQYVSTNGVMIGVDTGEFAPDAQMTRAMVVTVLARLSNADINTVTESGFEDVPFDSWHGKYVGWAKQNGIVNGTSPTTFCPEDTVTREQVCVMLSNFLDLHNLSTSNVPRPSFADEADISYWAKLAVLRLQYAGIINGRGDNNFSPKDSTTRAEFAQIVTNSNLASIIK